MADTRHELVVMLQASIQVIRENSANYSYDKLKKEVSERVLEINAIIERANDGVYHDFKSELTFPKRQLVADLDKVGLQVISRLVKMGAFDEDPDADDQLWYSGKRVARA